MANADKQIITDRARDDYAHKKILYGSPSWELSVGFRGPWSLKSVGKGREKRGFERKGKEGMGIKRGNRREGRREDGIHTGTSVSYFNPCP